MLDVVLALAEAKGWEAVRLREAASGAGLALPALAGSYRDLDAVADAWFVRLRDAMLAPAPVGFATLPAAERVHAVLMRWFDAAAPHRRVTGAMIRAKLYPSHPHHWVPLAFSLSRLIQWVREAALLDGIGRRRQVEEVGLTALFLAALATWLADETEGQERTRNFLRRRLANADAVLARLPKARAGRGAPGVTRPPGADRAR